MKTKEFIRKIENLGFEIEKGFSEFIITSPFDTWIAVVDRKEICQINNNYSEWGLLNDSFKKEVFNIISEYASTPPDERKEEKKYYLRHRWIFDKDFYMYLRKTSYDDKEMRLGIINFCGNDGLQFTLKEIEKIKKNFNTDLKDFEMIEVEI